MYAQGSAAIMTSVVYVIWYIISATIVFKFDNYHNVTYYVMIGIATIMFVGSKILFLIWSLRATKGIAHN